ncbi:MAG TPA: FliM/FliN family flagellar motor switch protein [Bryobacteraceae bacterium]|nr:FliM/FliN family flagellar motor switch protein [Bryobacteraceae bacterium]
MAALEQIAHFADIPAPVNVELDRVTMTIREVLALQTGSVIKTSRAAGENIGISIGGALIGSGEIVIMDESVAIRITDFQEED